MAEISSHQAMQNSQSPPPLAVGGAAEQHPAAGDQFGVVRDYRSHTNKACDNCRQRKSRCTVDLPGKSCLFCRLQGKECTYLQVLASEAKASNGTQEMKAAKRHKTTTTTTSAGETPKRIKKRRPDEDGELRPMSRSASVNDRTPPDAMSDRNDVVVPRSTTTHIIGPTTAEDIKFLHSYTDSPKQDKTLYDTYNADPTSPVMYMTVPRYCKPMPGLPCQKQLVMIEQIIAPYKVQLLDIYFTRIHPSFPILPPTITAQAILEHNPAVTPSTICEIYASSIIHWRQHSGLVKYPAPDMNFLWSTAHHALQDDFHQTASMSTLYGAVIDMGGRPVFSMTGNWLTCGRSIALGQTLGLNKDPSRWKLSREEITTRKKLWWALVIHDKWASFSHGVPSLTRLTEADVPIPTLEELNSHTPAAGAATFIALCNLTVILNSVLKVVFTLSHRHSGMWHIDRLQEAQEHLTAWYVEHQELLDSTVPGTHNLKTCYHALHILVKRTLLQYSEKMTDIDNTEFIKTLRESCLTATTDLISYISSLRKPQFLDFWMPYTIYHIFFATIIYLRLSFPRTDYSFIENFLGFLERARKEHSWELGELTYTRLRPVVTKLSECVEHCKLAPPPIEAPPITFDDLFSEEFGNNNDGLKMSPFLDYWAMTGDNMGGLFTDQFALP